MVDHAFRSNDIAIVGMKCRFPDAPDLASFWINLATGFESVSPFSDDELRQAGVPEAFIQDPNYVKSGTHLLAGFDHFDANFFGFTPLEAAFTSPQHRLFLEASWHALEHAGQNPSSFKGLIGVYASTDIPRYLLHMIGMGETFAPLGLLRVAMGNEKDHLPTWVSYKLGLKGPSVNVQTSCSSSLVGVHLACQSLLIGDCDMALAGGVSLPRFNAEGYHTMEGGIASKDGHCRAFDTQASGTISGSGVGVVVLKRAADALADNHTIYALIRGSAINNDGDEKVSYSAPGLVGQTMVIREALTIAEVDAQDITYIETHGTGTFLGDPIEVSALTSAFDTDETGYCALGSVKTNIGHADAAAGIAGLIKTVLCLVHKQIPPSLHFSEPNPGIDFKNSPFFVNNRLRDWVSEGPRFAGVSSFGIGGTNAHVILEEAPALPLKGNSRSTELFLLSAKTLPALARMKQQLADVLPDSSHRISDVAATLRSGRNAFTHRVFTVSNSLQQVAQSLTTGSNLHEGTSHSAPQVTFLFPGQGSQYALMGRQLYEEEVSFRLIFDQTAEKLRPLLGQDPKALLFAESMTESALADTSLSQPMIFLLEYSLARLWVRWGVSPRALMGHSLGEYSAACLAGVFSLDDALRLVVTRGRLMQSLPPGAMLSVYLSEENIQTYLQGEVELAAVNSDQQCVVSGPVSAIEALAIRLAAQGITAVRLATSHAFHSAVLEQIISAFETELVNTSFSPPLVNICSSLSGEWLNPAEMQTPQYWLRQMRETVRFNKGLHTLLAVENNVFLEVGPGNALTKLAKRQSAPAAFASLSGKAEREQEDLLTTVGQLWLAGVPCNWNRLDHKLEARRLALPLYSFEPTRHWRDYSPPQQNHLPQDESAAQGSIEVKTGPVTYDGSRVQRILDQLGLLLQETFGLESNQVDVHANFFDTGVDSLLMIQMSQAIERCFSISVPFRRLYEDYPTLVALASFLDQHLPPDLLPAPQTTTAPAPQLPEIPASEAPSQAAVPQGRAPHRAVEELFQQQLKIISEQISWLNKHGNGSVSEMPKIQEAPPVVEPVSETKKTLPVVLPFRAADAAHEGLLNAAQRQVLAQFIREYCSQTAESKRLAQQDRSVHADPRNASGFRRELKELIYPIFSERSKGSRVWDVDGNEQIDLTNCFGACLLGHQPDFITKALAEQIDQGYEVGLQRRITGEVARMVCSLTGVERVAFSNTGTEAIMHALRIARTVTGKNVLVAFAGSFHGTFDGVLGRAIGNKTLPVVLGTPPGMLSDLVLLEYGAPESLTFIRENAHKIGVVMVEPVQSRQPDFFPISFLRDLRQLTQDLNICYIFDEVVTGFRAHPGGGQAMVGIKADLVLYGKILGGGLPLGMVAGKARFMDAVDGGNWSFGDDSVPQSRQTVFAGTFCKHPLAMAAARATLLHLVEQGPDLQERLSRKTARLVERLRTAIEAMGVPIQVVSFTSLFRLRPTENLKFMDLLPFYLIKNGLNVWEGGNYFLTTAHTDADIDLIFAGFCKALEQMQAHGFLPASGGLVPSNIDLPRQLALTDEQHQIWVACQFGEEASVAFNQGVHIKLQGAIQVDMLQKAYQQVVSRHDALRTLFSEDGLKQTVLPHVAVSMAYADYRQHQTPALAALAFIRSQRDLEFSLSDQVPIRAALAQFGDEEYYLLITIHHIVSDGFSHGVVFFDLKRYYEAAVTGVEAKLPPSAQFSDYVSWLNTQRKGPKMAEAEAFWLQALAGDLPVLDFPYDFPRPQVRAFKGRMLRKPIDSGRTQALREIAANNRATLLAVLLAVYQVLVSRLAQQRDIIVGVPAAGQFLFGDVHFIGSCVNFLPLRSKLSEEMSFSDHLGLVKRLLLNGFDYQIYPMNALLKKLNIRSNPSRPPLYSVTFNLDKSVRQLDLGDLSGLPESTPNESCRFDMFLNMVDLGDQMLMEYECNAELFREDTLRGWADTYQSLLDAIIADPNIPLRAILQNCEPAAPAVKSPEGWNQLTLAYPKDVCIHQQFAVQAAQTPQRVAVVYKDRSLTYAALFARANMLAHYLRSKGLQPEEPVAICMDRSLEMIVAVMAVLTASGSYVPLDPEHPRNRLQYQLVDCGTRLLLTNHERLMDIPVKGGQVTAVNVHALDLAEFPATAPVNQADPSGLAYVIYTSGSTGKPKGVTVTHRSPFALRLAMEERVYRRCDADPARITMNAPYTFDASVQQIIFLTKGHTLYLIADETRLDGKAMVDFLAHESIQVLDCTPVHLAALVAVGLLERKDLSLKRVITAGSAVHQGLWDRLAQVDQTEFFNIYGPTEATINATGTLIKTVGRTPHIGSPLGNYQIYLLDRAAVQVALGSSGEICIGGEGLARGYLNRPGLTAQTFVPNPFSQEPGARLYRTGDLARFLEDGSLVFQGRIDFQVKIRGYRIELGEIESVLTQFAGVKDSLVLVHEDGMGEKHLVAYAAARNHRHFNVNLLKAHLLNKLPEYMVPQQFVVLEHMPLTTNGKVDREALRAIEIYQEDEENPFVAPRNQLEEKVAELWIASLPIKRVGIHDNFLAMGGDSILAIYIAANAKKQNLKLSPRVILQHQTIAEQAAYLTGLDLENAAVSVRPEQEASGQSPLLPVHHNLFDKVTVDTHHHNQSIMLELHEKVGPHKIQQILEYLIEHHDILRGRIIETAEGPLFETPKGMTVTPFQIFNISHQNEQEQLAEVATNAALLQADITLNEGPLMRVAYFERGPFPDLLLCIFHHLVIDGVSWRIFLEDFQNLHQAHGDLTLALPAKTTPYRIWAEKLQTYALSEHMRQEADYWLGELEGFHGQVPVDFPEATAANTYGSMETTQIRLSEQDTHSLLRDVAAVYKVTINDVLLTAMGSALATWSGSQKCLVAMEGHGREEIFDDVDLTRTMGWFTSIYPVVLNTPPQFDVAGALMDTHRTLSGIPQRGLGYGALRFLAEKQLRHRFALLPQPQIIFNYLGQFDQVLPADASVRFAGISCGPNQSPRSQRPYLLEANGMVESGQLSVTLSYSNACHRAESVQALAELLQDALHKIAGHCRTIIARDTFPPSAFHAFQWSQQELDHLMSIISDEAGSLESVEDFYPLSPLQQGMLFHSLYQPEHGFYINQITTELSGPIDAMCLRRAFQTLLDRHPILRTHFLWEGLQQPVQVVNQHLAMPMEVLDWSDLPDHEIASRWSQLIDDDRRRGFDLRSAPLMRLHLVKTGDTSYLMNWSFHHILMDGWCNPLVFNEVFSHYETHVTGAEVTLPIPPAYRNYIHFLYSQDMSRAESFWRGTLEGFTHPTPLDFLQAPDQHDPVGSFGEMEIMLSESETEALNAFARSCKLTQNTLIQGAWALLLSRYSGLNDVVFGATTSGRPHQLDGVERMIGIFINSLPIRIKLPSNNKLVPWLQQIQHEQFEARDFEYCSLVDIQGWSQVKRGEHLFETIMSFQNFSMSNPASLSGEQAAISNDALSIDAVGFKERPHYPLSLLVRPGQEMFLKLYYNPKLFTGERVMRTLEHLKHLLLAFSADPNQCLSYYGIMTHDEREQLVASFNQNKRDLPAPALFHQLFQAQVEKTPQELALVCAGVQLSYKELNAQANRLSYFLMARGVGPEKTVGILTGKNPELVICLLAVLKAGAAFTLLNPSHPLERLTAMIHESSMSAMIVHQSLASAVAEVQQADKNHATLDMIMLTDAIRQSLENSEDNPPLRGDGHQLAYVIFTSGSTGLPKGVLLHHKGFCNLVMAQIEHFQVDASSKVLLFAALNFDAVVSEIGMALCAGATLMIAGEDASILPGEDLAHQLVALQITHLTIPPSALALVPQIDGLQLQTLVVAGEACPIHLAAQWAPKVRFINAYGPTETTVCATMAAPYTTDGSAPSMGKPLHNGQVYLLDRNLQPVPIGVTGELYIGGLGVARGYSKRPGLTANNFIPNPFGEAGERLYASGDLARFREDGQLEFSSRIDRQVKIRGYRIEPGEIEAHLVQFDGVFQAVVLARPDKNDLVAFLVLEPKSSAETDQLRNFLLARLPEYMVPSLFVVLPHLPLTSVGKLDQETLRNMQQIRPDLVTEFEPPADELEQQICDIWREVLSIDKVGVNDNFFDLGGHSLHTVQLHAKLQKLLNRAVKMTTLFEFPSVRQMARFFKEDSQQAIGFDHIESRAARQKMARKVRTGK